jgi:ketosteroid isomerase-like protein
MKRALRISTFLSLILIGCHMGAQTSTSQPATLPGLDPLATPRIISPITSPTVSPGALQLLQLESRFAADVAKGGGKAFASWFAEDGITLNNGKPPVYGRNNIEVNARWDPRNYHLTWVPEFAQMGPSNDAGFTWGHYDAHGTDKAGKPFALSGRYITFWKKLPDGSWKVALDASADEPPAAADCCSVPKP